MASMAQPFNPGMAGMHPGGQPMAHHPSNQGMPGGAQPGVSMGQPMHPGMAGPGMPQVTQGGPMMGMMPGGGPPGAPAGHPNTHAMQHLNPGQGQMFPGQQMVSPQQMEAQQRQAMLLQQSRAQQLQQRQMMHQQQQQNNGGMAGNPIGQIFHGNPAMRTVNLTPHLQQAQQQQQHAHVQNQAQQIRQQAAQVQQQQQLTQQQQQQNAQQNQQAQPPQGQQPQSNPQQRQQQQAVAQQNAALQTVSPAGASQGHHPPPQQQMPTPQIQQGGSDAQAAAAAREQAQQQAHMAQHQQAAQHAQQAQQQQSLQQQQAAQQQQNGQQPQPPQQQGNAQNNQQQQQQQGQQAQPGQHQNTQQAQQQRQIQGQQQHMMQQRHAAMRSAQNMMQAQQRQPCSVLLGNFRDLLGQAGDVNKGKDLNYWHTFVDRFFSEDAVLRVTYWSPQKSENKTWELSTPSLARFFCKHYESGVKHMQLYFEQPQQRHLPDSSRELQCQKASLVTYFESERQVISHGRLQAHYNPEDQMEMLVLTFSEWTEYIPRTQLKENAIDPPDVKQSPNMSKSHSKRAQQQQQKQQAAAKQKQQQTAPIPETVVREWGIPNGLQEHLEMVDTMSQLSEVFRLNHSRGGFLPPREALQIVCSNPSPMYQQQFFPQNQQQQMNPNIPPHVQGQHPHFGAGGPPNNFLSPAQPNHPNLPGTQTASPATLSNHNTPAMPNMHLQHQQGQAMPGLMAAPQGIAMSHQASHQGTNPSQAGTPSAAMGSANASPNVGVTGKRRRPSGIDDGDINGPIMNGVGPGGGGNQGGMKIKQSPKVGGKKGRPNG